MWSRLFGLLGTDQSRSKSSFRDSQKAVFGQNGDLTDKDLPISTATGLELRPHVRATGGFWCSATRRKMLASAKWTFCWPVAHDHFTVLRSIVR
jgi:hypothetical protein